MRSFLTNLRQAKLALISESMKTETTVQSSRGCTASGRPSRVAHSLRQPHRLPLPAEPLQVNRIGCRERHLVREQKHIGCPPARDGVERGGASALRAPVSSSPSTRESVLVQDR